MQTMTYCQYGVDFNTGELHSNVRNFGIIMTFENITENLHRQCTSMRNVVMKSFCFVFVVRLDSA